MYELFNVQATVCEYSFMIRTKMIIWRKMFIQLIYYC